MREIVNAVTIFIKHAMLYTNLINLADTALHNSPYLLSIVIYMHTVNPTFIHVRDVFERVARALLSQIFLAANLSFDSDHNMGLEIRLGCKNLVIANQFISRKSRNKVAANKGWFAVSYHHII